jgi:decaprenylphospho-beta-D-erythro-pentofuranosid-2-ulose 2-reductase
MSSVLILGATSDIARAIARAYVKVGRSVILAARNPERLELDLVDLQVRAHVQARSVGFDVLDITHHGAFLDSLGELPDTIVCVVGGMGDQAASEREVAGAELVMRTNYVGPVALFSEAANRMATRGTGTLIGISSVAGERGRARNYIYGSAKAGFTVFLSGLRQRLAQAGTEVRVVTVLPGFVRTSATAGMTTPGMLTAEPKEVADAILRAESGGPETIFVRPIWRVVMAVIRALPESIFKKLRI